MKNAKILDFSYGESQKKGYSRRSNHLEGLISSSLEEIFPSTRYDINITLTKRSSYQKSLEPEIEKDVSGDPDIEELEEAVDKLYSRAKRLVDILLND